MTLYSYVVARDYGFAPNPFFGACTLATCKPDLRRVAQIGDWIVGTGSARKGRSGHLVFVMQVAGERTFDEYWVDERFQEKKPDFRRGTKHGYGDNIYYRVGDLWSQADSHHSLPGGEPNEENLRTDTSSDRVLIGWRFAYWGGGGPVVPAEFRRPANDLCIGRRGHKRNFPSNMQSAFLAWFDSLDAQGCLGRPLDWPARR